MKVRITRTVIVSSPAGMKRFAPGLEVTVTDDEAAQVFRQKAGFDLASGTEDAPAAEPAPKATKPRGKKQS